MRKGAASARRRPGLWMSFQDELRVLLRKHEIEWDEKYVWD